MSGERKLCLRRKRERELYQEAATRDISDDFQEAATLFRLPKRLRTVKSQGRSKKNVLHQDSEEGTSTRIPPSDNNIMNAPEPDTHFDKLGSDTSAEESDLQEIQKTFAETEKLCISCKLIVPSDVFADHFKECLQRYKLTKKGCVKQFPVVNLEEEISEQENQLLPCPICKKAFKSKKQRVLHIKTCAQNNGLTSEQLLLASRLLEKQTEEWHELGLPTALQLHTTRPKVHCSSKYTRDRNDPDVAMAIALSRSIAEEEVESRFSREENLLALGMEDIVDEDRQSRPLLLLPPDSANCKASARRLRKSGKDQRGRQFKKSVLATRSVEDRERLISEKVAVMLTSENTTRVGWSSSHTIEPSRRLACVANKKCQLWDIARSGADETLHSFYVPELEPFIQPKETAIGGLFRQLSQIPGRLNTTALHALEEESESECELEEASEIDEFSTQMALAELLGSQEDWDTATEIECEQTVMDSQGFLLPSCREKSQEEAKSSTNTVDEINAEHKIHVLKDHSDSRLCKLNRSNDVNIVAAMEKNPNDQKQICDVEESNTTLGENSDLKNEGDTYKLTESPLCKCVEKSETAVPTLCSKEYNNHFTNDESDLCVTNNTFNSIPEYCDSKSVNMSSRQEMKRETLSLEKTALQTAHISSQKLKESASVSVCGDKRTNPLYVPSEEVTSVEPHSTESSELEKKNSYSENVCHNFSVDSKETSQSQQNKHCTDILLNQAECNDTATVHKTLCSIPPTDNESCKYVGTEKQLGDAPLHSSWYGKEDIYKSPIRKNIALQSCGKDNSSCSDIGMMPDHEICGLNTLARNYIHDSKSSRMIHTLIHDWSGVLQSGTGSDVTIATSEGSSLGAHSLVLLARCPQLYKESKANGNLVKWDNVPQTAAYQFLFYLYTGTCKITAPGDPLWIELYDIALQYCCQDLVSYMELLYKAKNTPVKTPVKNLERDLDARNCSVNLEHSSPLHLAKEVNKHVETGVKTSVRDLENRHYPTNSSSDLVLSLVTKTDKYGNDKVLKLTNLFDEKDHKEQSDRSPYANKSFQGNLSTDHGREDRREYSHGVQGAHSPDLFDEYVCVRKSHINSTALNSPLIDTPQYSPFPDFDQLEAKELEEVSCVPPKTSSPCKTVQSVECRGDMQILPCSSPALIHSSISKKKILKNYPNAADVRAIGIESKTRSPLSPVSSMCELGGGDDDGNVIDLTQSGSKCNLEICVPDLPSVSDCQTETVCQNDRERVSCIEHGNEEPSDYNSDGTHEHYISNIWDDFSADSSVTFTGDLHTTFPKPTPCVNKMSNSNGPCLNFYVHAESSHDIASTHSLSNEEDPQREKCIDTLQLTRYEEEECLRFQNKSPNVPPSVNGETGLDKFTEGHPSDETLVNVAAEIEEWYDACQSRNQTQPNKSIAAAQTSNPVALTPHQISIAEKVVTPKPDYSKMKSPELKKELKKYGICALGRRKAVVVLQHVYEQTHPLVTDSEAESSFSQTPQRNSVRAVDGPKFKKSQTGKKEGFDCSPIKQKLKKSSAGKDGSENTAAAKESEKDVESEDSQLNSSLTSTTSSEGFDGDFGNVLLPHEENILSSIQQADLVHQVQKIITSNEELHRKVLLYEPVFVEDFHATLKANGTKCSMQVLLDVLDDLCIIVRTHANQKNRNRTKSSRKRRNTSPKIIPQGETA